MSSTCKVQSVKARKSISSDQQWSFTYYYDDVTVLLSQRLTVDEAPLLGLLGQTVGVQCHQLAHAWSLEALLSATS